MLNALTSATHTQPVAQTAVSNKPSAQPKSEASGTGKADAVQLSSTAQAALQEASETPAQTAKEAGGGDMQAKRLLTKESAGRADVK